MTGASPVVAAGAAAIGLGLALAVAALAVRPAEPVGRRLAVYFGDGQEATTTRSGLRNSATTAAAVFVPAGVVARLARRLAGAGTSVQPSEWVLLHAGIVVGASFLGLLAGGPLLALLLALLAVPGPLVYLRLKHRRRLTAFAGQLPETLTMISSSLSAGLSVPQAIDTVVRDGQEPMAGELRRALVEQRLGVELDDALDGIAARMGSVDFAWVVMAYRIQREVGGNLAEVLTTVADTLREREYVRRQVRTLSAEGRLSAYILGMLPVALFCYMLLANRDYISVLYTTGLGVVILGFAGLLLGAGAFVMSRMVKVEV